MKYLFNTSTHWVGVVPTPSLCPQLHVEDAEVPKMTAGELSAQSSLTVTKQIENFSAQKMSGYTCANK